jgi:hypothetical protein
VKIGEALDGVRRLYTETAPLISYVEENPTYVAKMDAIIEAIEASRAFRKSLISYAACRRYSLGA